MFSLKNKVILITGATGYLGSAMVEDLSKAEAILIVLSRSLKKAKTFCHSIDLPESQAFEIDLTDENSVKKTFNKVYKTFGKIDVLVNNACFAITKKYNDYEKEDWKRNFDESLISIDIATKAIVPFMKEKNGKIINISSMYGIVAPNPEIYENENDVNPLGYGVAKAALIQYTKYMAMQLAKYKINVNSISYGPFPNPENVKDTTFLNNLANKTMLKRVGISHEASSAVFFLSLDESSYITGQNIVVDGGWTSW